MMLGMMAQRRPGRPANREYVSPREAAEMMTAAGYEISGQTVARECTRGGIKHMTTPGGHVRILKTTVEEYLQGKLYNLDT